MKQYIKILFFFTLPFFSKAQVWQTNLDSLKTALTTAPDELTKMVVLFDLAGNYAENNRDSCLLFADEGVRIAKKMNQPLWIAHFFTEYQSYLAAQTGNLTLSLKLANEALDIEKDEKNEKGVFIPKNYEFTDPHKFRLSQMGYTFHQFGNIYLTAGNTEKGIQYYKDELEIFKTLESTKSMAFVQGNMNIGQFFVDTDKLDSAIIYNKRALSYSETTGWRIFNGIILRSLGLVYLKRNKIDSVKYYYWQSLLASRQQKNSRSEINTSLNLAYLYAKLKRRDSAKYYAKNAFFEAINFKSAEIVKGTSAGLLALLWKEEGNLDSAFVYLTISKTIGDSLSKDWSNKINKFQNVNFEEQLRLEKEAQENLASKNKIRTTALFAGLGLLSILAFVFYRNNRQKQKANLVLQEQKEKVESTLQELKSTQTQLIQSEKMASLGELTAGIAHEIQNPLNFVNNFSELNNELLQELGPLDKLGVTADQQDILKDLQSNSEKINHHGQRAAAIVKGMLQHSRTSSGQKEPTDVNALCDEYLRLAYHGLRAKDKNFNAEFKTEFDETIPKVNIVPQDMGRVVLNLINNAFFAVGERGKEEAISHKVEAISSEEKVIPSGLQLTPYSPTVTVSTKNLGNKIEITVSDNGTGIPSEIKEKIFQPFFTTKPTGQGTGLGLSLAYDIVKAHGGEIMVESTTINGLPNRAMGMGGTKFIITLPIS